MRAAAARVGGCGYGFFRIGGEVIRAGFAERLATAATEAAFVVTHGDSRAALGSEDRRKAPSAEEVAQDAVLRSVIRRLVGDGEVVEELDIETVRAVVCGDIEGVESGTAAGGLGVGAGAERASPGEVRDGS